MPKAKTISTVTANGFPRLDLFITPPYPPMRVDQVPTGGCSSRSGTARWASGKSGDWEPVRPQLVCEVEYDYFSQGRFRHGSKLLRWRPDKKPSQCTMGQVAAARAPRGKGLSSMFSNDER